MKKVARATACDHEKPSEILTVFARFFQVIPIFDDTLQTKMRHLKPILLTRVGISPQPGQQQRSIPAGQVGPIAGWLTNTIYSRHLWIFGKGGVINKYSVRLKHDKKADRDGIVQQTVAWLVETGPPNRMGTNVWPYLYYCAFCCLGNIGLGISPLYSLHPLLFYSYCMCMIISEQDETQIDQIIELAYISQKTTKIGSQRHKDGCRA